MPQKLRLTRTSMSSGYVDPAELGVGWDMELQFKKEKNDAGIAIAIPYLTISHRVKVEENKNNK